MSVRSFISVDDAGVQSLESKYDVVIIGGGHNGLVSACYLAKAGLSVLILERNAELGGATKSARVFDGMDARLSVYSYLVSLFPEKIVADLGLELQLCRRKTASFTPGFNEGAFCELLIRNGDEELNRDAFARLTGGDQDYRGYLELQRLQEHLASVVWPSLTSPMMTRDAMRKLIRSNQNGGEAAWDALVEEPLGEVIESLVSNDLIRGLLFTDAKIGVSTYPGDPSLLQNRLFLYHIIGRGTGEWRVPVGGMGALVGELIRVAQSSGKVTFARSAEVTSCSLDGKGASLAFEIDGTPREVAARYVLCNASSEVLAKLMGTKREDIDGSPAVEGSVFKMNMLLEKLPRIRTALGTSSCDAFAGTFHIDEGYQQMVTSYQQSMKGEIPDRLPGEVYCHTLTDDSILSEDLRQRGFQTLTLFGLDAPYRLFEKNNEEARAAVLARYLEGLNRYLEEPIESCLARDAHGNPCLEAKSPVDLENEIRLPKGNIFHGDLSWPFVELDEEAGQWGVETGLAKVFLCGSAAMRGGCVSGIPGHNAAMKVLELERKL